MNFHDDNSDDGDDFDWQAHWRDMPEFVQEDLWAKRTIKIHFRSDEDVQRFAALIGQTITPKQKSLWFPEAAPRRKAHLRYLEKDEIS